jgi:methylenetetrahydrofolate reductase (NADPH)
VHNDFHAARGIFPIFDGLEVKDMDKQLHEPSIDLPGVNGHDESTNGTSETNGTHDQKSAGPIKEENPGLIDAAKAAAIEVTNGVRNLMVSN